MKMIMKTAAAVLLTGFLSLEAQAGFEQFANPVGEVNVFANNGGSAGGWLFWSGWGLNDLQARTTDNRTFLLAPNTNTYGNGTDPYWVDIPNQDGNKWMVATCHFRLNPIVSETSGTFSFDVTAFDLDPRYTLKGFIEVLDPGNNWQPVVSAGQEVVITSTGSHTLNAPNLAPYSGMVLQAGWRMEGLNANPATNWGSATVTATALFADTGDVTPPSPDPMTFSVAPAALSDHAVTMTATTATDASAVEYLFTNTVAGTSSGWQTGTTWKETGLPPSTLNTYRVKARDTSVNFNETAWSTPASATTLAPDFTPPSPDPMTFAASNASPISIMLTATPASDASAVEYLFTNTVAGTSSGWQSSSVYIDTGLVPGSNYTYTVQARDVSAATNMTAASAPIVVTTLAAPPAGLSFSDSLTGYTNSTDSAATLHELAKAGFTTGSIHADSAIDFGPSGAVFGDGFGATGRNILKTIAADYEGVSFVAYATLTFSGSTDLSGFIGMGQGLQTGVPDNYGVPELNLAGVNGVVAQFKDSTAGSGVFNSSLFKLIGGSATLDGGLELLSPPIDSTETIRARLIYDATNETVNVSIDKAYAGGAFQVDQDLGTVSTTNAVGGSMWTNAPVRVYVGGGEGTVVKDFEVMVTHVPLQTFDLAVADTIPGGGVVFNWTGAPGQTYEVQYRTDLTSGTWITDPTLGDIVDVGGAMSATSTVSAAQVFYRFILK